MLKVSWKEIDETARRRRKFSEITLFLAIFDHFSSNLKYWGDDLQLLGGDKSPQDRHHWAEGLGKAEGEVVIWDAGEGKGLED